MPIRRIFIAAIILFALSNSRLCADVQIKQPTILPPIQVAEEEAVWRIKGERVSLTVNKADLAIVATTQESSWKFAAADENDIVVSVGKKRLYKSFLDAGRIEYSVYETGFSSGIKITLDQFKNESKELSLIVQLFITLETNANEVVFRVAATENRAKLRTCIWPKAFLPESFDFTVVPFMQGMLLPKDWAREIKLYDPHAFGRGLYMPWWGHMQNNAAALLILETPNDASADFKHPENGPTSIAPLWQHSMSAFSYDRRARVCFIDEGNYVDMAKRYRRYTQENGHFTSLKEKIARTPNVGRLIGSPVLHTSILYHTVKESSYYDKENPENNHRLLTFDDRLADIKKLKERGIDQLYIHLDGWGWRGYDNLHPDYLPPSPEAGGWEAMKRLVDCCRDMGYLIALHDQYRDYYLDALSHDPKHALMRENGSRPFEATWAGGAQTILCASLAPGFVAMNHNALREHGIFVDGSYLDVFAVVPPEECYNPDHRMDRAQCLQNRGKCFSIIKNLEGIVSSEEPVDWAIPYLDLVHHGPYALHPNPGGGPAMGIPIPLFNLVYHDAIILPWSIGAKKGGWGIPDSDSGYLHGLLNAGMPYISINPSENELEKVESMCGLNKRLALQEMVDHEFVDGDYRRQKTTFEDGTTVTVDFESGDVLIIPKL